MPASIGVSLLQMYGTVGLILQPSPLLGASAILVHQAVYTSGLLYALYVSSKASILPAHM
jgi:hypothetical protein